MYWQQYVFFIKYKLHQLVSGYNILHIINWLFIHSLFHLEFRQRSVVPLPEILVLLGIIGAQLGSPWTDGITPRGTKGKLNFPHIMPRGEAQVCWITDDKTSSLSAHVWCASTNIHARKKNLLSIHFAYFP